MPGTNGIEIVATDAVGNVAVKRVETVYDIDPPEILSAAGGRPDGAARADRDRGRGARRLGPAAGGAVHPDASAAPSGAASCAATAPPGLCRETLPPEPGALALVEVAVEDYAGNVAKRQE